MSTSEHILEPTRPVTYRPLSRRSLTNAVPQAARKKALEKKQKEAEKAKKKAEKESEPWLGMTCQQQYNLPGGLKRTLKRWHRYIMANSHSYEK